MHCKVHMPRHIHRCILTVRQCSLAALLEWEALRDASYHTEDSLKAMDVAGER